MDEFVLYLVVNSELSMSTGKTAAQCGHAVEYMLMKYFEFKKNQPVWPAGGDKYNKIKAVEEWHKNHGTKVILRAKGAKFQKLKEVGGEFVVTDLGKTELVGQNETVIGFWPIRKSMAPKELTKLRLL